jgi:hypothetical protein
MQTLTEASMRDSAGGFVRNPIFLFLTLSSSHSANIILVYGLCSCYIRGRMFRVRFRPCIILSLISFSQGVFNMSITELNPGSYGTLAHSRTQRRRCLTRRRRKVVPTRARSSRSAARWCSSVWLSGRGCKEAVVACYPSVDDVGEAEAEEGEDPEESDDAGGYYECKPHFQFQGHLGYV